MNASLWRRLLVIGLLALSGPIFAGELKSFSAAELQAAEAGGGTVVLAFHSSTCGTCKRQKPVLDSLLKENDFANFAAFRVDLDTVSEELEELKKRFKVSSSSTVIVLKAGQEIVRSIGLTKEDSLRSMLRKGV